jgi:hypothetical protein
LQHPGKCAICCNIGRAWEGAMTNLTAAQAGTELAKPYEPTAEERAALAAYLDWKKQKPPLPPVKLIEKGGTIQVEVDHPMPSLGDKLIMQAHGTADADFFDGLLGQLASVSAPGKKPDERALNFMLAMIKPASPSPPRGDGDDQGLSVRRRVPGLLPVQPNIALS